MEVVKFNSTVTLSQQYDILSGVADEFKDLYENSENETIANSLGTAYETMKDEFEYLSEVMEGQLQGYDKEILNSSAILTDQYWLCLLVCEVILAMGCGTGCAIVCSAVCGPICVGCIWIWTCPVCFACVAACGGICAGLCCLIGIYGVASGCGWLCSQLQENL